MDIAIDEKWTASFVDLLQEIASYRETLSNGAHCYFCHLIYKPATDDGFGPPIPIVPGVDTHGVFPEPGKARPDAELLAFLEMDGVLCLTEMVANLLVGFYNQRGTAVQWIKEGKYALNWTRLSCHGFADNQMRLQRFALAYNLGNFLRRLALPREISHWSLRTLQTKLVEIEAKVVRHARHLCFQMAEMSITWNRFAVILRRIRRLIQPVPV